MLPAHDGRSFFHRYPIFHPVLSFKGESRLPFDTGVGRLPHSLDLEMSLLDKETCNRLRRSGKPACHLASTLL